MSRPRFTVTVLGFVFALALACSRQTAAPTSPSASPDASSDAASDGSTLKAPAPVPLSPINNQTAPDFPTLTAKPTAMDFDGNPNLLYHFEVFNDRDVKILDSGQLANPSYKIDTRLEFKKRHTWRVRAEMLGRVTSWSDTVSFISFEGGYIRDNEVFDPLYDGTTVGERINDSTFVADQGIKLESNISYVRYLIPTSITSGEFSMEVKGLRPFAPGDKSKVFGMSSGTEDFITDPYRFDAQYRGVTGSPPNAITYRILFGDDVFTYQPDTDARFNSIYLLNPDTWYFWKFTWGKEVRLLVREGGINGKNIYEFAIPSGRGTYNPVPHFAYLGTPPGRSGAESASIPFTIYRNVWIGARSRPTQ